MPNQHKKGKKNVSVRVEPELYYSLQRQAKLACLPMSSIVIAHLVRGTENVILTKEDHEKILKELNKRDEA